MSTDTTGTTDFNTFERVESEVRSYSRSFPKKFNRAQNATLFDMDGNAYTDFLAGCSSLNYGHNDPDMKKALVEYIMADGVAHGLDMFTDAKERFLETFENVILKPRDMNHKVMFTGPTGANAVEAALKLARKVTGRENVIAFTNGFHGMTMGALAATGNAGKRGAAGVTMGGVDRAPYDSFYGADIDSAELLDKMLSDSSSGIDAPAAFIVETVQGEGGLNAASSQWLRRIEEIARKHGALFIIDDIQAGCGRTGSFFSFEDMGLSPDIVTLAKSLSGMGLPFAVTLFKPELDVWKPAEHNGTFRGNNHAFVTARVALEKFWSTKDFQNEIEQKSRRLNGRLTAIAERYDLSIKGRGMMLGVNAGDGEVASEVCAECFRNGLIIETSGSDDEIVKVLAPLTIDLEQFDRGLDIVEDAFAKVLGAEQPRVAAE